MHLKGAATVVGQRFLIVRFILRIKITIVSINQYSMQMCLNLTTSLQTPNTESHTNAN